MSAAWKDAVNSQVSALENESVDAAEIDRADSGAWALADFQGAKVYIQYETGTFHFPYCVSTRSAV